MSARRADGLPYHTRRMHDTAFILICDGDRRGGEEIEEALRRAGNACHLVETGEEAIDSIRRRRPDVLIVDSKPNGSVSGLDVLRRAHEISPTTATILMAAHGSEKLARDALKEYGAFDYVAKPVDVAALGESVAAA